MRILFIGNSFTNRNDVPGMLVRLAAAARPSRRVESDRLIANGQALKSHWTRGAAPEAIRSSKWQYVVLQEQSTLPLKNPRRIHEYVTLFDEAIRQSGAKTVLYMTWARRHEWDGQADLTEAYTSIGRKLGAIVVPVGLAWERVLSQRPDLVLHDRDDSHPNFAGSYLAARVFFATLFTQSPTSLETSDATELARIGADVPSNPPRRRVENRANLPMSQPAQPPDSHALRFGPYRPPSVFRGDNLFCEIRGTVTVGGYSDAPIPWPRMKKRQSGRCPR